VKFTITAYINPGLDSGERAWALRAEVLDHGGDYHAWAGKAKQLASALESQLQQKSFASQAQCQSRTRAQLNGALHDGIVPAAINTINKYDNSNLHNYANPNRRP
jgi:hypothetical protein